MSRVGVNKGVRVLVVLIGTKVVALGASLVAAVSPVGGQGYGAEPAFSASEMSQGRSIGPAQHS
jgi:hypothetical protein